MAAEEINLDMQPRELLQKVNKAIAAVLVGGQSYRIGTRSLTRADLSMLKKLREELQAEAMAEEGSSLLDHTYVAYFEKPR